jgi:hypothetical protein
LKYTSIVIRRVGKGLKGRIYHHAKNMGNKVLKIKGEKDEQP